MFRAPPPASRTSVYATADRARAKPSFDALYHKFFLRTKAFENMFRLLTINEQELGKMVL
ncbi:MAG: hypothetical protein A2Y14_00580 [Verrucomicrobia bacterium GWF2_51_19]|nr:MAG: hypothetical protein A2Y14_00580 [Verrucomicrobia bacterium GWF2_51_19]